MLAKIDVIRALSSIIARRALAVIGISIGVIALLLLIAIWALAHFFSTWWWLLMIVYVPCLIIVLVIFSIAEFIARKIYPHPLTNSQKQLFTSFADKIQRLLESRGMGWPVFAFLCAKDLLFYRELRTMKSLINDTTSLKRDFSELEQSIGKIDS